MTVTPGDAQTGTDLRDRTVVVAGLGVTGRPRPRAARPRCPRRRGRRPRPTRERELRRASCARSAPTVRLGDGTALPDGADLVVTSPGWRPDSPAARRGGRGRPRGLGRGRAGLAAAPGRPGTVARRHRHQRQDHDRADARVDPARPPATARSRPATSASRSSTPCSADPPYDVLAVELSSFQLHWTVTVALVCRRRPQRRPRPPRLARLARGLRRRQGAGRGAATGRRLQRRRPAGRRSSSRGADVRQGFRAIGSPWRAVGRARRGRRRAGRPVRRHRPRRAVERGPTAASCSVGCRDIPVPAPHNVANALAAAALARAYGVRRPRRRAADGLRAFGPGAHRIAHVADGRRRRLRRRLARRPTRTPPRASLSAYRLGRVGRRRPGQGRDLRRARPAAARPAARRRADRRRPGA